MTHLSRTLHPSQLFEAPNTIQSGTPLKNLFNETTIELIGQSFLNVLPHFDHHVFVKTATQNLEPLTLLERASHIAKILKQQLPQTSKELSEILIAALGPSLERTDNNGLATFFYMPHSVLIHDYLVDDCEAGMRASYELTSRFTAEFSIRPFVIRYPEIVIPKLYEWTNDKNPHVRRLVSEGTRPRLPWAERLPFLQKDPKYNIELLEKLKDDESQYVRRSVANHLGDIAKDNPKIVLSICEKWLSETLKLSNEKAKERKWLIRHAIRFLAKKNHSEALDLRIRAK